MHSLDSFLEILPHSSVICIGDVMLDYFIYGSVERISPEAPVPIFRMKQKTQTLGGAGNVARNLSTLHIPLHFLSVIGSDSKGQTVTQLLQELNNTHSLLIPDEERSTTNKTRYIAHNQQLLRADEEDTYPLKINIKKQLMDHFDQIKNQGKVLILSDYGKGIFDREMTQALIEKAQAIDLPIIVDPKKSDFSIYQGATVITPNLKELSQAWGGPLSQEEDIEEAALALLKAHQIDYMLVTRSEQGMSLIHHTGEIHHIPTQALEVFDVSGAGDTVLAVFAAAYGAGIPPLQAAQLANLAAGIVVSKVGTATTTAREIQDRISAQAHHKISEKVYLLQDGQDQVIKWRRQGLKIGFTNGCFDLLHPGHISLLKQARAACDRLVVGLNSDDSVKRLKGPQRPLQHHDARAIVLSGLEMVDMIIVFDEDTPLNLIQELRPDVLIKGADYTLETVIGSQEVINWGGKVILASLIPEQSTTKTIQRIGSS